MIVSLRNIVFRHTLKNKQLQSSILETLNGEKIPLGIAKTTVPDKYSESTSAYITHFEIFKEFRNNGYGNSLLQDLENHVTSSFNVNTIEAITQNKQSDFTWHFFLKNNYNKTNDKLNYQFVDDGVDIYELYHYVKKFN